MYTELPGFPNQGSVVEPVYFEALDADFPAVILTPSCDIEQSKANFVTCVALRPFQDVVAQLLEGSWKDIAYDGGNRRINLTVKQTGQLEKRFRELFTQQLTRYHWFDSWSEAGLGYIGDFQLVTSVTATEPAELKLVAHLDFEYREALPARYVSYMGRIGTPDRLKDAHLSYVDTIVKKFFS